MTFYEKELNRISAIFYSNHRQIETVIGIRKYIEKPVEMENLARSVRDVLDRQ